MAETSPNSPDDRRGQADKETLSRKARKETLAAPAGTRSRHGRFEPGQQLGSRYRIVGLLGTGGMGEVYRADDLELGQSVALKFLPERVAADQAWLRRFRNEVRTSRQVAHPNVCRVYDIGDQDGHVFISMEYIDGEDLASVLRRLGRPSREKSIEIARQICLGLAAAHENGVLHRDLKPENIMIDGRGVVRITDFGLAGFLKELENAEARAGTPAYMAPEQLTGGKVSVRSDIYTLGLVLHELFTGKRVFSTNDIEELKRKHSSGTASSPSSITEEVDPTVERVIMRCLQAEPQQRPNSVYQVLAALPGTDPLAAALAAGETPSPDLVANARDAGGLRPLVAVGLVLAVLVSILIVYVGLSGAIVMPDHAPARLSVVAEQVLEDLGYVDLPRFSVSGYDTNFKLSGFLSPDFSFTAPRNLDQIRASGWPPRYRYWRRWSDGGFLLDDHMPWLTVIDGPTDFPGRTVTVALDSTGRLLALSVPPSIAASAAAGTSEVDWQPLLDLAHLSPDDVTQMEPDRVPSVACDTVVAWRIDRPSNNADPVTVLTGAVGARPSYFEYTDLHDDMAPNHNVSWNPWTVAWMIFRVLLAVLGCRNLLAGRADKRNAFKCALLVGGLYAVLEVVSITLGGSDPAQRVFGLFGGRAAAHCLIHAIESWMYYLAIEPYVRRVWPRMLIGLVRILSGRWRDPAVGREVLIGLATGCALVVVLAVVATAQWRVTADDAQHLVNPFVLRMILSPGHYVSSRAHLIAGSVLFGMSCAGVVVLIRLLVRHALTSAVVSVAVLGFLEFGFYFLFIGDSSWANIAYAAGMGTCLVWLYTRIGVLAAMVFRFIMFSAGLFTIAFDAWSTPYLVSWLAILLALTAYGFWVSLAGQPLFKDMLAEPQALTP